MSHTDIAPPGYRWIYRPYITRGGRRIYAASYGLKAFRFLVPDR